MPLVANVSLPLQRVPDFLTRVLPGPHAGERPRVLVLSLYPATDRPFSPPVDGRVRHAVTASDEVAFGRVARRAVVAVRSADEAIVKRIHSQRLLEGQALDERVADEILPAELALAELLDRVGVFEVRELVVRPERTVHFGIALDLHHLHERLEAAAHLGVGPVDRLAGGVHRRKHRTFAGVRIVRNGEHPHAGLLEAVHPLPRARPPGRCRRNSRPCQGRSRSRKKTLRCRFAPFGPALHSKAGIVVNRPGS